MTTVVAFGTRYALTYRWSQRLWRIKYNWRLVLVLSAWAVGIVVLSVALPEMNVLVSLALRTAMVRVYMIGLWVLLILSSEEKAIASGIAAQAWTMVKERKVA